MSNKETYVPMKHSALIELLDCMEQDFGQFSEFLTSNSVEAPFDWMDDDNWDYFVLAIQDVRNYIECKVVPDKKEVANG